MENQKNSTTPNISYVVGGLVVAGALIAVAYSVYSKPKDDISSEQIKVEVPIVTPSPVVEMSNPSEPTEMSSKYLDGSYTVLGNYVSPGGPESIEVTITIQSDRVVDSQVISKATLPGSMKFQKQFIDGHKEMVIGKSIDELSVDKVSGSSLTPMGFNDAVEQIKSMAMQS